MATRKPILLSFAVASLCALSACTSSSTPSDEGSYTLGGNTPAPEVGGEMDLEAGSRHFSGSVGVYTGYSSTDFRDARRASTYR